MYSVMSAVLSRHIWALRSPDLRAQTPLETRIREQMGLCDGLIFIVSLSRSRIIVEMHLWIVCVDVSRYLNQGRKATLSVAITILWTQTQTK